MNTLSRKKNNYIHEDKNINKKNPILILSTTYSELSTEKVIDWILSYDFPFYRINAENLITDANQFYHSKERTSNNNEILSREYHSIWYRRYNIPVNVRELLTQTSEPLEFTNLSNYVVESGKVFKKYFLSTLKYKNKFLTTAEQTYSNKLEALKIARNVGLNVPFYFLTNNKADLCEFFKQQPSKKLIVKDYVGSFAIILSNKLYTVFTEIFDERLLRKIPNAFYLSFFQEYIEKEYEIRSFYLNGDIYSMAIFSQKNARTKVDFRRYDFLNPNRNVPYKLPKHIETKIRRFMKESNLTTGSIDILKGIDNKFYFLEVNPIGQFGMVSIPCNYHLEKIISNYLVK